EVEDSSGTLVSSDNSTSISLTLGGGTAGATLLGTNPITVTNGVAAFTDLSITTAGTGYTLMASATNLTSDTSTALDLVPDVASQLVFPSVGQPTDTVAGKPINGAAGVVVQEQDKFGNVETGDSATQVSIALTSGPLGGQFATGSTTSVTLSA